MLDWNREMMRKSLKWSQKAHLKMVFQPEIIAFFSNFLFIKTVSIRFKSSSYEHLIIHGRWSETMFQCILRIMRKCFFSLIPNAFYLAENLESKINCDQLFWHVLIIFASRLAFTPHVNRNNPLSTNIRWFASLLWTNPFI